MSGLVTQIVAEAVIVPTNERARITQLVAEAVVVPTNQTARVTQLVVEAVIFPTMELARLTQAVVEVIIGSVSPQTIGALRAMLYRPVLFAGVIVRSRIIPFANGVATFVLDPSEAADFVVVYAFRGNGIGGGKTTFQITAPYSPQVFDIISDDEETLIVFGRGTIPTISFVGSAREIEIHFALFTRAQLDDLRRTMRLRRWWA